MHLDMLCGCVRKSYPTCFPNLDNPDDIHDLTRDYEKMLIKIIKNVGNEFDYDRVFETTFLSPGIVSENLNSHEFTSLFLGYPDSVLEEKLTQIRAYGQSNPHCWTNRLSDSQVMDHLNHFISVSKVQRTECEDHQVEFFDCSNDFDSTFSKALDFASKQFRTQVKS